MQSLDGATYDAHAAWKHMLGPIAAEVRTAADRPVPLVDRRDTLSTKPSLARNRAATDAATDDRDMRGGAVSFADADHAFFDPWFSRTMGTLAAAKDSVSANARPQSEIIGTAEMLAAFLVEVDPSVRPQLMMDDEGGASYGTSIDGFYLNLTIDSPGKITWYALVNDKEHFEEGASFSGRNLPAALREVLQLPSA